MKINITFFILIFFNNLNAQLKEISFGTEYLPNKSYEMLSSINSISKINFEGTKDFMKYISENGIKLPIISKSNSNIEIETNTKSIDNSGNIPFEMNYKKVITEIETNDKKENKDNHVLGTKIYGNYFDKNKIKVDSLFNDNLNDEMKKMLVKSIENISVKINYPEKPLKIGDSFQQNMPMDYPVPNVGNISFIITTIYYLDNISDEKAYFNTKQDIKLNSEIPNVEIIASGNGIGKSEFDIKNKVTSLNQTNLKMKMGVKTKEIKIISEIESFTNYRVIVK